jgi:hypothetical protein
MDDTLAFAPPAPTGRADEPAPYLDARDHFAACALQGELASQFAGSDHTGGKSYDTPEECGDLARWCYQVADAMLAARRGEGRP